MTNKENLGFPSIPTPNEIANAVSNKIMGGLKSDLNNIEKSINEMGDVKDNLKHIKETVEKNISPVIPALESYEKEAEEFISEIANKIDLKNITSALNVHSKLDTVSQESLTGILDALSGLIKQLKETVVTPI
jgi:hypothetical protein